MSYMTDERRMIQTAARDFAMNEVLPIANKLDPEQGDIPMSLRDKLARDGLLRRRHPGGVRRARPRRVRVRADHRGTGARVDERREHHRARQRTRRRFHGGAAARVSAADGARRISRRGGAVGAGRGFRSRQRLVQSDARRRRLDAQRHQDLVHVRRRCGFHLGARAHEAAVRSAPPSRRHQPVPGAEGARQISAGADRLADSQDWLLRMEDVGAALRQSSSCRPTRCSAASAKDRGEGKGFYGAVSGLEVARVHTAARAIGLARGGLEDALAYAQKRIAFGQPIGEFQAIRFKLAEMATEIEAARQLTYFVADRSRQQAAMRQGSLDGEAVRFRDGRARHQPGAADSRRLRLHQGLPARALLARRAPDQNFRGHFRNPAANHLRSPAAEGAESEYRRFRN